MIQRGICLDIVSIHISCLLKLLKLCVYERVITVGNLQCKLKYVMVIRKKSLKKFLTVSVPAQQNITNWLIYSVHLINQLHKLVQIILLSLWYQQLSLLNMHSACKNSDCLFNNSASHIKILNFRIISINCSDQNKEITIKVLFLLMLALQRQQLKESKTASTHAL